VSIVVIGSGPTGVAAAKALVEAGHHVVVLDAGREIEPERMEAFNVLAESEPSQWSTEDTDRVLGTFPVGIKSVGLKPAYGSLFPYAIGDADLRLVREGAEALASLARGGLSNVWGASILPFRASDIGDWPISLDDLRPHYESVLRFVPLAGERDELDAMFPLYTEPHSLPRSAQTEMIMAHLRRNAAALHRRGFRFGASRLAVVAERDNPRSCRNAGLCLYGCPYGSIYSSAQTLDGMIDAHEVDYRPGVYVDRLSEQPEGVRIDFHTLGQSEVTEHMLAARVFVACGCISSTRLMLQSMGRTPAVHSLNDSQYFLVPLVTLRAAPVGVATQGNTLAQVFLELLDRQVSAHTVHFQLYTFNDLMLAALAARLPISQSTLERLLQPLFGRLLVALGYLHSSESQRMSLRIAPSGTRLVGEPRPVAVGRVVRRLATSGRLLGMFPIPGIVQTGLPGKSQHVGGSFPMRHMPAELESDLLGCLPDFEHVHVVDASVFPSMPATTVTLTAMANAHRIAATVGAMVTAQPAAERRAR
jgi:choline dehydrogenase-like flavoprotein